MANVITQEKVHQLEEILLKSKDEVIDLQKRLVDVSLLHLLIYLTRSDFMCL